MNLSDYIADYFIKELNLRDDSIVFRKLKRIKYVIYLFLLVNMITCGYAFYMLFNNIIVSALSTLLFQFVFLMVYIVLFATVRKSDFQKPIRNIKVKSIEKINDQEYPAQKFILDKPIDSKISARGWKDILFRLSLLIALGIGPSFFFGMMINHNSGQADYEIAKQDYINNKIATHNKNVAKSNFIVKRELDSLLLAKNNFLLILDSLNNNPDPNGYYQEDIAWYSNRLADFNEVNAVKIKRLTNKLELDSIAQLGYEDNLRMHYNNAQFFMLRANAIWKKNTLSYFFTSLLFLFLLIYPFLIRYRLIINNTEDFDSNLEKYYVKIIQEGFSKFLKDLRSSLIVKDIEVYLKKDEAGIISTRLKEWMAHFDKIGDKYEDPALKSVDKSDPRVFIDKGNLSRYLGKL
jgi:hypothetical protein